MAAIDISRLNDSQRDVVLRLDEPLFVAAGAGSGKTFTLTARLVHALSEGSCSDGSRYLDSIDEALIITFTKAAALEIKDRVRGALREAGSSDPHLREESLRVDNAWISTIHGMCSRILRRHGIELGIDASFKLCDDSVAEALLARALDEIMAQAQNDEAFSGLLSEFPLWGQSADGSSIVGMVRQLRGEAIKCVRGYSDLACPQSTETASLVASLQHCLESLAALKLTKKQAETVSESLGALLSFTSLPPNQQTPALACEVLERVSIPAIRKKEIVGLKEEAKRALAEALVCAHFERVQTFTPQLVSLAQLVDARYAELKHERSYLDNDDLIELALRAVETNKQVARDYEGRFKLVMIDEFQDTDEKQLRLISLLSGAGARHLTTVGDAQQSIYRFRGGDVEVFRERGRRLPDTSHVQMDVNYRSDHHVLALVERVCRDAQLLDDFLKLAGNADRRSSYSALTEYGEEPPRIFFEIAQGGPSTLTSATLAAQIADRLAQLAKEGQPIGSMALLLGTTSKVRLYLDALRSRGLPAIVTGGSSFSSTHEVGIVQALLHTLANPHDTEIGLFRVLSSDMFRLDADDFCLLGTSSRNEGRTSAKQPIESCFITGELELFGDAIPSGRLLLAHEVLNRAFSRLGKWSIASICLAAIEESGWLSRLEEQGTDGLSVAANVLAAIRYVQELTSSLGLGMAQAAEEFDQWLSIAKLTPKTLSGDTIDAVQVMTIHGSKGLQFGVTAVAECWGSSQHTGRLCISPIHKKHMVCLVPKPDSRKFSRMKNDLKPAEEPRKNLSVAEWAGLLRNKEQNAEAAEKARLLYVALTRAEEALVVGLPVAEKEHYRSQLAMGMLGAFPELDELSPGTLEVSIEPENGIECECQGPNGTQKERRRMEVSPALARVVCLQRPEEKDDPWTASSAGTLAGFDGELPDAPSLIPILGTTESASAQLPPTTSTFNLFDANPNETTYHGWRPREGIYSYSSLHAQEESQSGPPTNSQPKRDSEAEGSAYTDDQDKATSLGSAFHALAQTMVQANSDHSPKILESLATTWHLSQRQRLRLQRAIGIWETSELRKESNTYALRRAEAPFFVATPESPHGSFVEGSIDLLCTQGPECEGKALVIDYKTGDVNLTEEEVRNRHFAQAELYAKALLSQGFEQVDCAFICVETGMVVRWTF